MQLYIVRHGTAIDREDPNALPIRTVLRGGVEKKNRCEGVAVLG